MTDYCYRYRDKTLEDKVLDRGRRTVTESKRLLRDACPDTFLGRSCFDGVASGSSGRVNATRITFRTTATSTIDNWRMNHLPVQGHRNSTMQTGLVEFQY
jgi:hypothetical protein